jgi:quinolinate synthase
MKKITLPKILRSLEAMEFKVEIPEDVRQRAARSMQRMMAVGRTEGK